MGGVIAAEKSPYTEDTLGDLPNLTAISASRYDRTSFGCGLPDLTTYFGGELNNALSETPYTPDRIDWKDVYEKTNKRVSVLETNLSKTSLLVIKPSLPQYFSNVTE